jgi:hypothetical protein
MRIDPDERIVQKSIGFEFRQHRFFDAHPEFNPSPCCRHIIDEQIKIIDSKFLKRGGENGKT